MTEQELLSQLNNLKNIKPDSQWKTGNQEILLNQISSSQEEVKISWLASLRSGFRILENMLPQQLIRQLSQPVWAVVLIMVIVFGGGIVSLNASRDTKPGDSLYIAKVISEKTQLAITFNEKEKVKLGIEFAGNRTKEITQVLAEADNVIKEKEAKVEKLSQNFKKEISAVKARLVKIDNTKNNSVEENNGAIEVQDEDMQVFSANLEKTDQRMQIYDSASGSADSATEEDGGEEPAVNIASDATSEGKELSAPDSSDLTDAIEEAERLFNEKDYNGTLDKLSEANDIINDAGEAKIEDTASTTKSEAVNVEDLAETASSTGG